MWRSRFQGRRQRDVLLCSIINSQRGQVRQKCVCVCVGGEAGIVLSCHNIRKFVPRVHYVALMKVSQSRRGARLRAAGCRRHQGGSSRRVEPGSLRRCIKVSGGVGCCCSPTGAELESSRGQQRVRHPPAGLQVTLWHKQVSNKVQRDPQPHTITSPAAAESAVAQPIAAPAIIKMQQNTRRL